MSLSKTIETAIKMETDAMQFYKENARELSHPFGKKMFEGFVLDELNHLKNLQKIMDGLDIEVKIVHPKKDIKTVFSELKDKMSKRIKATSNEIDTLKIALDFENEGYKFYQKAVEEAQSETEKAFLEMLVKEEKRHFELLQNTYNFLNNTGDWFMWEEHGLLEG
jgi:rubrerythrin